jgi:hypothetical protein
METTEIIYGFCQRGFPFPDIGLLAKKDVDEQDFERLEEEVQKPNFDYICPRCREASAEFAAQEITSLTAPDAFQLLYRGYLDARKRWCGGDFAVKW